MKIKHAHRFSKHGLLEFSKKQVTREINHVIERSN